MYRALFEGIRIAASALTLILVGAMYKKVTQSVVKPEVLVDPYLSPRHQDELGGTLVDRSIVDSYIGMAVNQTSPVPWFLERLTLGIQGFGDVWTTKRLHVRAKFNPKPYAKFVTAIRKQKKRECTNICPPDVSIDKYLESRDSDLKGSIVPYKVVEPYVQGFNGEGSYETMVKNARNFLISRQSDINKYAKLKSNRE